MTVKVNFVLSADIAGNVDNGVLVGEFNNWDKNNATQLKKEKDGSFSATLKLEAGKSYQYRYFLNDGRWVNDDRADKYSHADGFGAENCVVNVPAKKVKTIVTSTKKDDLTKIEGIGKKIAEQLVAANIDSFNALSNATVQTLQTILNEAGSRFKSYNPTFWASQAKLAADDKWDELKALQKELKSKSTKAKS